ARELRRERDVPVGMIGAYKGGTPAESWTSVSGLGKEALLAGYLAERQKVEDNFAERQEQFPRLQAEFQAAMKEWNAASDEAKKSGAQPPRRPNAPPSPDGGFGTPGNLFNGMIAPLTPFAMRGVIWYQGESNGDHFQEAVLYKALFKRMILDWREAWGREELAFLFVELANFIASKQEPEGGVWPWVRDGQRAALALPMTGMASAIDIGNATDIHPLDKVDVGVRLALAARRVAYGEKIVDSGPVYDSLRVEGNKIRLMFTSVGGGLVIGVPPWAPDGKIPSPSAELRGFVIAAADGKFVPAKAVIEGGTVVVSADGVSQPAAVRYNWADNPKGNLYNREGLPAPAFRTDEWAPVR
ncbi:MAG: sialate O-acetylesterase, partial [Verrucomicrobiales bacterium]|nr:sialate O-acetylesterase [Verrucomicrobiales bacterium]